jgi:hypothetical protein
MSEYLNNYKFFNEPISLSEAERSTPLKVLQEFFADYNLSELRHILAEIKEVCLTTDRPPFSEPGRRADYLCYEKGLIGLLEAAFLLGKTN